MGGEERQGWKRMVLREGQERKGRGMEEKIHVTKSMKKGVKYWEGRKRRRGNMKEGEMEGRVEREIEEKKCVKK